jgi:hypothetical protein
MLQVLQITHHNARAGVYQDILHARHVARGGSIPHCNPPKSSCCTKWWLHQVPAGPIHRSLVHHPMLYMTSNKLCL